MCRGLTCEEAGELAACRVEGGLDLFEIIAREKRAAIVIDHRGDQARDRFLAPTGILLDGADQFATQPPEIVAMPVAGRARQAEIEQVL